MDKEERGGDESTERGKIKGQECREEEKGRGGREGGNTVGGRVQ